MILDLFLVVIFVISIVLGRKAGLFRTMTRLLSLVLSAVLTALFGAPIREMLSGFSFYGLATEKLEEVIEAAALSGETELIMPFLEEADMVYAVAAKSILDMLLTSIIFIVFFILLRIVIEILDKTVFHLPLIRPLNRNLGMVLSFAFTGIVSCLVIGFLGGVVLCSEMTFLKEQFNASVLVRGIYENNMILKLFLLKG